MAGWHISIGYSGGEFTEEEAWEALKEEALELAELHELIAHEAVDESDPVPNFDQIDELLPYAERYSSGDSTMQIIEDRDPQVILLASGQDPLKIRVRRSFVRLLMERMHKRGIDINFEAFRVPSFISDGN